MGPLPLRKNTGSSKLSRPPPAALMENKTHKRTKKGKTDGADKKNPKKEKKRKRRRKRDVVVSLAVVRGSGQVVVKYENMSRNRNFQNFI